MTDETRLSDDQPADSSPARGESATPTATEASRVALFAVFLVILVLILAAGVWWYVTSAGAADEQAAAKKMRELGAFVHPPQEDKHANTVNLTSFSAADAKVENLDAIMREIPALAYLQNFNATNTPITDEHLEAIGQLDSLTQVILDNDNGSSRVTDAGVAHLTGLDNLISLNMYGTQITRKGLESIAQIESLKILNIGGTDVTGDLSELGPLENLEWLLAADLELSDDAVESLAALPKLSHLSIRNGTLSEEARAELAQKKPGLQID